MAPNVCGFPPYAAQKWKFPKPIFFDILTIHNDQISYVKEGLDPLYMCTAGPQTVTQQGSTDDTDNRNLTMGNLA